jgi:uncharacterized protein
MDVTPHVAVGRQIIQSYGPGRFRINDEQRHGPLLVFPERVEAWDVTDFASLTIDSFAQVIAAEPRPEVMLLGCGDKQQLVPSALRAALRQHGIVVDMMDTGAACRTYNVLLTEERRVVAALFPVT